MSLPYRLRLVVSLFVALFLAASAFASKATDTPVRFAMTPAFLHDQHAMLETWRSYLAERLGRPVEFVQRDRYRETMDLLQQQRVEFAWLCDYPYVALGKEVRLMAVALNNGRPTYRSYLVVPASDQTSMSIADLKGAVFAYADPHSNTGYLVPRFELRNQGVDSELFFRRTFFTWSHRKAVSAVAAGLAQGTAVDSYVWDSLAQVAPELTAKTRIVWKSEEYGFPPIVAHANVSTEDFQAMQRVLLGMQDDETGRAILARLHLDGFIEGSPQLYDSVAAMMKALGEH